MKVTKFTKEEREFLKKNNFKKIEGCNEYFYEGKVVAKFNDRHYTVADTKAGKFRVIKNISEIV